MARKKPGDGPPKGAFVSMLFGVHQAMFLSLWAVDRTPYLVRGIPSVLLISAFLGVLLQGHARRTTLRAEYLSKANTALDQKAYPTARLCYERVAVDGGPREPALYGLAVAAIGSGERKRGEALMARLAPIDRQGYGPAHVWRAKQILALGPKQHHLEFAGVHLLRALAASPDDAAAHLLLSTVYQRLGEQREAEEQLRAAVRNKPGWRFHLARFYHIWAGQHDEKAPKRAAELRALGNEQARIAHGSLRRRLASKLDDHEVRLQLAAVEVFLHNFGEAAKLLRTGLMVRADPRFRRALVRVYAIWSRTLANQPDQLELRLSLLIKALTYDATYFRVLEQLIEISSSTGPEATRAQTRLERLLAGGKTPAVLHMLLGMQAWKTGNKPEAVAHFEAGLGGSGPYAAMVANNLAYVLSHSANPDLDRALVLIDSAIRRYPKNGRFRDTRGRILAKAGRWKEALTELEAAAPTVVDKAGWHKAMADVYTNLGLASLARKHTAMAGKTGR